MARCDFCGTTILFGGRKQGDLQFCGPRCQQQGVALALARLLPADEVQRELSALHQGLCPRCGGTGPVDVHMSHKVWSALLITSWRSTPRVSCRSCGVRAQLGSALFSAVLGWWGFPWGLLMTPVQIGRNLVAIARGPDPARPSAQLERLVRLTMVARNAARSANGAQSPPAANAPMKRAA
ncbi:MAG TPA: hypothetical protein VMJ70_11965 [Candidatus Sulfotelmatobacter sp.]|nr:hypothetical protein [Candidatus Sulfotelmatobacter sp.]